MKRIRFEMKKYILRRSGALALCAFTALAAGFLVFGQWHVIMEKTAYKNYMAHTGEVFTGGTKAEIQKEYEALGRELFSVNDDGGYVPDLDQAAAPGTYGKTKIEDYKVIGEILSGIAAAEKRDASVRILLEGREKGFLGDYYAREHDDRIVYLTRLGCVAGFAWLPGFLSCLTAIFWLCASFCIEANKRMLPVLCATKNGEDGLYLAKTATGCLAAVLLNVYYFAFYLAMEKLLLGIDARTLQTPLFYADGYGLCASGMTVGALLLKGFLLSVPVTVFAALLIMVCSKYIGKGAFAALAGVLLFFAGTCVDVYYFIKNRNLLPLAPDHKIFYLASDATLYRMMDLEKKWNPFSLLSAQYYFQQPRFVVWMGWRFPAYVPALLASFLSSGLCMACLLLRRRRAGRLSARFAFLHKK